MTRRTRTTQIYVRTMQIAGKEKLRELNDVDVSWVSDGDVLKYDWTSGKWKPGKVSWWGGGGATKFTELTDTPNNYTGQANKVVVVKSTEDGLTFSSITTTDEKVALNASDTPWYLEDKIDGNTIKSDWTKIAVDWSALNVDKVDWKDVDDTKTDNTALWTAQKIKNEIITTTSNKADKVAGATAWNLATLDASWNLVDSWYKPSDFAEAAHTHTWNDIDKTWSKLSDIENVPTPTSANTYLKYDGSNYVWDFPEVKAKASIYKTWQSYSKNELITDNSYSSLFIATKDFVATDIVTDTNNWNIKSVTSSWLTYKQQNAFWKKSGDSITISLTKSNSALNRHVFVLKKQEVSSVNIEPFKFDGTDTNLDYDSNWVIMDGDVHLKKSDKFTMEKEDFYYKKAIDTTLYKDIVQIDVNFIS